MATIELPLVAARPLLHEPVRRVVTDDRVHFTMTTKAPCSARLRMLSPTGLHSETLVPSRGYGRAMHLVAVSAPLTSDDLIARLDLLFDEADAAAVSSELEPDLAMLLGAVTVVDAPAKGVDAHRGVIPLLFGPFDFGDLEFIVDNATAMAAALAGIRNGLHAAISPSTDARLRSHLEALKPGSTRRRRTTSAIGALSDAEVAQLATRLSAPTRSGFDAAEATIAYHVFEATAAAYQPVAELVGANQIRLFGINLGAGRAPSWGRISSRSIEIGALIPHSILGDASGSDGALSVADFLAVSGQLPIDGAALAEQLWGAGLGETSEEDLARRFEYFSDTGRLVAAASIHPLGFSAEAQVRIVLPDFDRDPAADPWVAPEDRPTVRGRRWVTRSEILRATGPMGRRVLGDASWNGDLERPSLRVPRGTMSLSGLRLERDYFPGGGIVAAMRMRAPRLLTEPPPIADLLAAIGPAGTAREQAIDRLIEAARPTEEFADLTLHVAAPTSDAVGLPAARQLAALRNGASSGSPGWRAADGFVHGRFTGSMLGLDLGDAPFAIENGELRADVTAHLPTWLTRRAVSDAILSIRGPRNQALGPGIDALRAHRAGTDLATEAARQASVVAAELSAQGVDVAASGVLRERLEDLFESSIGTGAASPADPIALVGGFLPRVQFGATLGDLGLPARVARWFGVGAGPIELRGYSPLFESPQAGALPGTLDARHGGGLSVKLPSVRLRLGPFDQTLLSPAFGLTPPASPRGTPRLSGSFDLPTVDFGPFTITAASLEVDTGAPSPVVARLSAEPLRLGPLRLEPQGTSELSLTVDAARGSVECGPCRLRIRTPFVSLDAELSGATPGSPFVFSTTGAWSGTARLTRLRVQNPFRPRSASLIDVGVASAAPALVSGRGGIESLGVVWTEGVQRVVAPFAWLEFASTASTDVLVNALGEISVTMPAQLPRAISGLSLAGTLRIGHDGTNPFAQLDAATARIDWLPGAALSGDFAMTDRSLECENGTLVGRTLADLFRGVGDSWRLVLERGRRATTLSLTGSLPSFDLGVFAVSGPPGEPVPLEIGPDGIALGPARISASLPGLTMVGRLHGRRSSDPVSVTTGQSWTANVTMTSLETANPFSATNPQPMRIRTRGALTAIGTSNPVFTLAGVPSLPFAEAQAGKISGRGSLDLAIEADGAWRLHGGRSLQVGPLSLSGTVALGVASSGAAAGPFLTISGDANVGPLSFASTLEWDGTSWRSPSVQIGSAWLGDSDFLRARAGAWDLVAQGGGAPTVEFSATTGEAVSILGQSLVDIDALTASVGTNGLVLEVSSDEWIELIPDLLEVRGTTVRLDQPSAAFELVGEVRALRNGSNWKLQHDIDWTLDIDGSGWSVDLVSGSGLGSLLPTSGLVHRNSGTSIDVWRHSSGLFGLRLVDVVFAPLWQSWAVDADIAPSGAFTADVSGAEFAAGSYILNAGLMSMRGNLRNSSLGAQWSMATSTVASTITDWPTITLPAVGWTATRNVTNSASSTPDAKDSWTNMPGTGGAAEYKATSPKVEIALRSSSPRLRGSVDLGSISIRPAGFFFGVQKLFTATFHPPKLTLGDDGSVDGLGLKWPSPPRPFGWTGSWPPLLPDLSDFNIKLRHLID